MENNISFSLRDKQITKLITRGYTVPQIADELGLSPHTIKDNKRKLYKKLNVHDKRELFAWLNQKENNKLINEGD